MLMKEWLGVRGPCSEWSNLRGGGCNKFVRTLCLETLIQEWVVKWCMEGIVGRYEVPGMKCQLVCTR